MDLQSLRVFLSIADTGSFSAAGEQLFLTQPAVSKRIAALEEDLGCKLFDHIGRQVRLTEAGQALRPRARHLLAEAQDLRRALDQLSSEISGSLIMATSHHIGLHRLPPVIKAFSERFPRVELDIRFLGSESACHEVEQGNMELGIVTLPSPTPANLSLQILWNDPLHIAVGRDHPLAEQTPRLQDLLAYPAVLPSPGTFTREILEQALQPHQKALRVGMCTDYLETLKMLAATGLGWALLPDSILDDELVSLNLPGIQLNRQLGIVTHRRHSLSNAAKAMLEVCREHGDAIDG